MRLRNTGIAASLSCSRALWRWGTAPPPPPLPPPAGLAQYEELLHDRSDSSPSAAQLPGFLRGRRYESLAAGPRYLALYEAQNAGVLQSGAYLQLKRNRDARSLQFIPAFMNTLKATCDILVQAGKGEGGYLVLLAVSVAGERLESFRNWIGTGLFADLLHETGIVAASFAVSNRTARASLAAYDVRSADRYLDGLIIVEAASEQGARIAASRLDRQALQSRGASFQLMEEPAMFRVLYALHALHA